MEIFEGKDLNGIKEKLKDKFNSLDTKERLETLKKGGKSVFFVYVIALILMVVSCLIVFFLSVQGEEQVMVPNVQGKSLTAALLELQERELYPKIQMHYSEMPGDKGTILSQSPRAGSIVKAYRRIDLTVSRGEMITVLGDYVGKNIDEVRGTLDLLFSEEDSVLKVSAPVYKKDSAKAGTIIAQYPPAETELYEPVKLQFIVSSGDKNEVVEVPEIKNMTVKQLLAVMNETKLVYDFTFKQDASAAEGGAITSVAKTEKSVDAFTRIDVELTARPSTAESESIQGILEVEVPEYPYPVPMRVDVQTLDGLSTTILSFNHPGKKVTVPYDVKKENTVVLYVMGEEKGKVTIQ